MRCCIKKLNTKDWSNPLLGQIFWRFGHFHQWQLWIVIVVYIFARAPYWTSPQVWDGRWNAAVIASAALKPFDILNYSVENHICQGFLLPMSIWLPTQYPDWPRFNMCLTLFAATAIIAFYKLALRLLPKYVTRTEVSLLSAAFAFHPTLLSNAMHFTLDLGALVYFLWYAAALLNNRPRTATLFATLMLFTKETAFLIVPVVFLFASAFHDRLLPLRWLRKNIFVLVLPYSALLSFILYKCARNHPVFWTGYLSNHELPQYWARMFWTGAGVLNFAGLSLILNFNWLVISLWSLFLWKARKNLDSMCLGLLCLVSCEIFIVSLVRPYSNPRYCMIVIPSLLIGACRSYSLRLPSAAQRIGITAALIGLFLFAGVRTIDPVSKWFFGSFRFGSHRLLHMTDGSKECCGYGRDQLVYNLEYSKIPEICELILQAIDPAEGTVIVTHRDAGWNVFPEINATTNNSAFVRSLKRAIVPTYLDCDELLESSDRPKELFYIAFPNFDNSTDLERILQIYPSRSSKTFSVNGYEILVYHFKKS
jgi:hypothetical protein